MATATDLIGNAITSVGGDVMSLIAIVFPVGLAIYGTFTCWRVAKAFFNSLSHK